LRVTREDWVSLCHPDCGSIGRILNPFSATERDTGGAAIDNHEAARLTRPCLIAVNRFYAPDHSATAQLLTDLAEAYARAGGAATIITSRLRYDDPGANLPAREIINGVIICRVWTSRFGRANLIGRSVDYATFYVLASLALLREAHAHDTILANTDPPFVSLPTAVVARLKRAHLVNWCHDLFPEIAAALGHRWVRGVFGKSLLALRNWSLRQARTNIVLCEGMRNHLIAQGVTPTRLQVIHNWPNARIRPLPRHAGERFTIAYSGNLGRAHDVDAIIALVERTDSISDLAWLFIGGGAGYDRLKQVAGQRALGTIMFEPPVASSGLSESLARADLHLVSLDPTCEGLMMPSKLYGIMAAGRPALFLGSPEGAVARILQAHDAGITLDSTRPDAYVPTIRSLKEDPVRLAAMARNARLAFERHYNADRSLKAWKDILTNSPRN
jgi:colanic acid biosynthesis glycosyl transferase WcaI